MALSFGTDGVRGVAQELLDEYFVTYLALAASNVLKEAVSKLPKSDVLSTLTFLDLQAISNTVDEHQQGSHDHAIALFMLLTLESALSHLV